MSTELPSAEEIVAALDRHPDIRDRVRLLLGVGELGEGNWLRLEDYEHFRDLGSLPQPFRVVLTDDDHTAVGRPPTWPSDFRISDELIEQAEEIVYNGVVLKNRTGKMPPRTLEP